jgi:hypothetical protein
MYIILFSMPQSEHTVNDRKRLLVESVQLELNFGKLYRIFADYFSEDYDFWWRLGIEENNHASLLRSGIIFLESEAFPDNWPFANMDAIFQSNKYVNELLEIYERKAPTRIKAFQIALELEQSAAESHYQEAMASGRIQDSSGLIGMFRNLNRADKDHSQRIQEYMKKHEAVD